MDIRHFASAAAAAWLAFAQPQPVWASEATVGEAQAGRTGVMTEAAPAARNVLTECSTNATNNDSPADVHGAVSTTRFVVVSNGRIGVYRREACQVASAMTLSQFFAMGFELPEEHTIVDARVIYDFRSNRFLVTARGIPDQYQYYAVSTSKNAVAWRFFRITLSVSGETECLDHADGGFNLPSPGVNKNRWLVSGNESPNGGMIISLEKAPTLGASGTPKFKCFHNLQNFIQPPIVRGDNANAFFLSVGAQGGSAIRRDKLVTTKGDPKDDTLEGPNFIAIPAWTLPPDPPQPNGQRLEALDGSFRTASIQIGKSLWNVHTVAAKNKARWRLYKLSTNKPDTLLVFTSKLGKGEVHNFNASVATGSDAAGAPAFVTYTRLRPGSAKGRAEMMIAKGPNDSAAGWATTLIERSPAQFENATASPCNDFFSGSCRWGTTSATQIDPSGGASAWGFGPLAIGAHMSQWGTRAGRVD